MKASAYFSSCYLRVYGFKRHSGIITARLHIHYERMRMKEVAWFADGGEFQ